MSDVFVSYKREDQKRVAPIVEGLRTAGFSVWWDRDLSGGEAWRQQISEALDEAHCVVVVWSHSSVEQAGEFVHEEAGRAKARGVLLPVRIDPVTEPLGFGQIQSFDLVGWRGRRRTRRFRRFVALVKAKVQGETPAPEMTLGRLARWFGTGLAALGLVAAVLGPMADLVELAEPICGIPGIHALCGHWGLGGVATSEEKALWMSRSEGDCGGLRNYLERFPTGAFSAEAENRLEAVVTLEEERWQAHLYPLPLVVRPSLTPLPAEEEARSEALRRAPAAARILCEGFSSADYQLVSAKPEVLEWRCLTRGKGFVCGFDGRALCQVQVREIYPREVCK